MKVTFFGTRGSIPVAGPEFSQAGGNTACVMITSSDGRIGLLDAGTGLRNAGRYIVEHGIEQFDDLVVGLSHTHWDHIQGFPFFAPAYDRRRTLTMLLGERSTTRLTLENIFAMQMDPPYFPVPLDRMGARLRFSQPCAPELQLAGGPRVAMLRHSHPGEAYSYRIVEDGRVLVYCTDVEHGARVDPAVVELARDADLLIHDAQYTPRELRERRGWGHSSWEQAVEVAVEAKVKRLALFHHDPEHDDRFLVAVESEAQRLFANAFLAREGVAMTL